MSRGGNDNSLLYPTSTHSRHYDDDEKYDDNGKDQKTQTDYGPSHST